MRSKVDTLRRRMIRLELKRERRKGQLGWADAEGATWRETVMWESVEAFHLLQWKPMCIVSAPRLNTLKTVARCRDVGNSGQRK